MRLRTLLSAGIAALVTVGLLAAPASAAAGGSALDPNQSLADGQRLVSPDGAYALAMQGDGNLVLYAPGNRAVWSTGTGTRGSSLTMQGDGNLVVYTPQPGRRATWAAGTRGDLRLELQNDGNLVLYTRRGHVAQWSAAAITDRNNVARVKYSAYVAMRGQGWADSEWRCLETLWSGESGWRWNATNRSSGAYGIPQSLPASKMATAGADWRDNPATQISWGLSYLRTKYGSPCGAYTKWQSRSPHWY